MSYLNYLGIYEDAINDAIETCENAMELKGFTGNEINAMHDIATTDLKDIGDFGDITNSIIAAYFSTTAGLISDKFPDDDIDYYINCHDSHFYINNEEVY